MGAGSGPGRARARSARRPPLRVLRALHADPRPQSRARALPRSRPQMGCGETEHARLRCRRTPLPDTRGRTLVGGLWWEEGRGFLPRRNQTSLSARLRLGSPLRPRPVGNPILLFQPALIGLAAGSPEGAREWPASCLTDRAGRGLGRRTRARAVSSWRLARAGRDGPNPFERSARRRRSRAVRRPGPETPPVAGPPGPHGRPNGCKGYS